MKRNLYLKTVPVEEALEKYIDVLESGGGLTAHTEEADAYECLGRVTAGPVFAKCCSPLFNAAAMDGIAVKSADTRGASESRPLTLTLGKDYRIIDTGDPVKSPFDAVIMAEDVIELDDETVQITESVPGWQHVRPVGEDIVAGEMIIPGHHTIRPVDIGVMLASGNIKVNVFARPRVGIIPTGTEIISPGENPAEGDIIDSNSGMFAAMVSQHGGIAHRYDIVEDDYEKIKAQIISALEENDLLVINAGSSAGTEDYTVHVLREIGQVIVHGVAMKPGKPVILAMVKGKPVIGLPGYPVSAYLAFENFVAPVIARLAGSAYNHAAGAETIEATISKRMVSSLKHREYVRVKVGKVGGRFVASPLARGAGAAMSMVRADGFCVIPQSSEGFEAGQTVEVQLYKDRKEIENTLVSIGSHDMLMDLINDMMAQKFPGMNLSSTHVGSMAGLMALQRGETVIAPTHLLDEETGEYNLAYIKKLFPGEKMSLIKGVDRIQGIMVKKGNPLGITGIEDLTGARYVNRQRGAGTRVLLDYKLKQAGISADRISGYDKEVATHMAVAACVASDEIDAGMGIRPAADAMGLDFVEVGVEEYDFAIHTADLELPQIQAFIEILRSPELHKKLEETGGYGWHQSGRIVNI
ncbi:MAG: molybdopterin biosynthesis protein [Firmicutes bacterium]|nr:molybdopterin biosynthesis protein [Bacillota bacterium]